MTIKFDMYKKKGIIYLNSSLKLPLINYRILQKKNQIFWMARLGNTGRNFYYTYKNISSMLEKKSSSVIRRGVLS